jgi:oncostatin M receptor
VREEGFIHLGVRQIPKTEMICSVLVSHMVFVTTFKFTYGQEGMRNSVHTVHTIHLDTPSCIYLNICLIPLQKNPHLIMNVKDCIPDVLEVINKAEGSKTQCVGSGKLHIEDVPTKPPIVPTEKDSSGPVPCIFFENFTYDQSAFDSGSHGLIPGPLKDTAHQLGLLAPPNKFQNVLKNDYMKPLVESPTEETSLIYVSQLASPMCGDKDTLATEPPVPVHGSEYKRQMVVPGSLASPSLKEDNSLTSTVLLGQGEQ